MSLRHQVILPLVISALALLAGCGGSGSAKVTPPPSGSFSNSSLTGTYVFSIVGQDVNYDFLAMTGTFAANGSGGISGGTIDINDSGFSSPLTNNPITAGTYSVTSDGRGKAILNTATPFGSTVTVDFVLASSNHGMITEFDANGSGSGSLDLQTSASQPAAGTYVFGLSGISAVSTTTGTGVPASSAGAITLDGSGNASGSFDYNNNSTPSLLTLNSGSTVSAGTTPGTATLLTSSGTLHFDVYGIDATHMKLIETDSFPILAGDLFSQSSSSFPSGQIAFTMAGSDYSVSTTGPLVVGGLMTSDGTANISAGEEDFDDAGNADSAPQPFTGTISSANGRYVIQLSSFENGAGGVIGNFSFAAYPSSGGIEMVEIDGGGVTSGVAFSQSSTTLAASQGYGLGLTASNANSYEEDDIAEFTTTSTGFSGAIDINDQGQQTGFDKAFSGTYTPDSPATGRGTLTSNYINGTYYTVDGSTTLFLELDSTQLGAGMLEVQNATAQSNLTSSHLAMLRMKPNPKKTWRRLNPR